jgi:hypothetical protein
MRVSVIFRVFSLMLLTTAATEAQDLLGLFVSGEHQYGMMGGNVFSTFPSPDRQLVGTDATVRPSLRIDYQADDIYHEVHSDGTETALERSVRSVDFSLPFPNTPLHPRLGLSILSTQSSALVDQSPSEHGAFEGDRGLFTLSYEMSLGRAMCIGAAMGQSYNGPQSSGNYESDVSFRLPQDALLHVKIGSREYAQVLQLQFSGTNGTLPLDYLQQGAEISLLVPVANIPTVVEARHATISSVPDVSRSQDTHFSPVGMTNGYDVHSMVPLGGEWKFLLSIGREASGGTGSFTSYGQIYGILNHFDFETSSVQAAVQHSFSSNGIIEADLKWQNISGDLEGHAEDWPFKSLFVSPIPVRENVKAEGSLRFWQFHVGGMMPIGERFGVGVGTSCVRILPRLELDSWESKFLVFGVRGYQQRDLPVSSIDAVILSGGFRWSVASFTLSYSATQFVPLQIERSGSSTSGVNGVFSAMPATTSSTHTSGGQFHQASVAYEF